MNPLCHPAAPDTLLEHGPARRRMMHSTLLVRQVGSSTTAQGTRVSYTTLSRSVVLLLQPSSRKILPLRWPSLARNQCSLHTILRQERLFLTLRRWMMQARGRLERGLRGLTVITWLSHFTVTDAGNQPIGDENLS